MHINTLSAAAFQGRDFTHALTPLVYITGPNFSGKSARAAAIRLALNGYLPEVGKRPSDTLELASASRCSVSVGFDTGAIICRDFERGKVSQVQFQPGSSHVTLEEVAVIPLLNPDEYFGLSAADQVNYVFCRVPLPDDCTAPAIVARLRNLPIGENGSTALIEEARGTIIEKVRGALADNGVNEGLAELTKEKGILKTDFTFWNRRQKDSVGAVRVLSELKTREGECSAETLSEIETEIGAARKELGAAQTEMGSIRNRSTIAKKTQARREFLRGLLAKPAIDHNATLADKRVSLSTLQSELAEEEKKWPHSLDEYVEREALLRGHCANAQREAAAVTAALQEIRNKMLEVQNLECCPFCSSKGRGWKKVLLESYSAEAAKLVEQETALATTYATLKRDHESVSANLAGRQASAHFAANMARRIRVMEQEIESLARAQTADGAARTQAEEELAAGADAEFPSEEETRTAADAVTEAEEKINALEERHSAAVKLQQDLVRAAEAAEEHDKAAANLAVVKAIGGSLGELKAGLVERVFAGLLETANGLLGDVLPSKIQYHEGEIGRWEAAKFVTHRVFSGTEKALTYIAIAAALSVGAPFKLVILDELARLTTIMQAAVLNRLEAAVNDGRLDQVVAILPSDHEEPAPTGWQLISL